MKQYFFSILLVLCASNIQASGPFDIIAMGGNTVNDTDVRVLDNVTEITSNQNNEHGMRVNSVAWQPCGVHLAMGGNGGPGEQQTRVYKFDKVAQTLTEVTTQPHAANVNSVAWSPDGCFLAIGGNTSQRDRSQVRVYRFTGTALELEDSYNHGNDVYAVVWSPDGTKIAIGGDGRPHVRVLSFTDGELSALVSTAQDQPVRALDWSPDGTRLVVGGLQDNTNKNEVRVLNPVTLSTLAIFDHSQKVLAVAWHPNGRHIAIGGFGPFEMGSVRQLRILEYDGSNTLTPKTKLNNGGGVNSLSWRCDGDRLAVGNDPTSQGHSVRVYGFNPGTGQLSGPSNFSHGSNVYGVDFLPCCSPGNICDGDCAEVVHQGPTCFTGNVTVQKTLTVLGCFSATECLTPSDRSIKTDVQSIDPASSIEAICSLNPITYSYTDEWEATYGTHDVQRGLIAQDVAKVLPELVHERDGIAQLDYSKLVVDLVGAVQHLQSELDELKK